MRDKSGSVAAARVTEGCWAYVSVVNPTHMAAAIGPERLRQRLIAPCYIVLKFCKNDVCGMNANCARCRGRRMGWFRRNHAAGFLFRLPETECMLRLGLSLAGRHDSQ